MAPRVSTAVLRDRIDGLGIAFFAVTGAMVEALAEVHPEGAKLWARLAVRAIALLLEIREIEQDVFTDEALDQAYMVVLAAFAGRLDGPEPGEPANDDQI